MMRNSLICKLINVQASMKENNEKKIKKEDEISKLIKAFPKDIAALEVCGLLTPLHIVPEWYFLCQYAMLKAVPNKNAGFIILLTSIFTFFFFGEIRNLTTFTRLMDYNNGFSISSFFLSLLSSVWIGAQFPQEKFLSYGRVLTLDFYFLIMCILFSTGCLSIFKFKKFRNSFIL